MDAVAVEGQRRIAEQQHRIGMDGAGEIALARIRFGGAAARGPGGCLAIDNVLHLGDRGRAIGRNLMAHRDEDHGSGLAGLGLDIFDGRDARHRGAERAPAHERRCARRRTCAAAIPRAAGSRRAWDDRPGRVRIAARAARTTASATSGGASPETPGRRVVIEQRRKTRDAGLIGASVSVSVRPIQLLRWSMSIIKTISAGPAHASPHG